MRPANCWMGLVGRVRLLPRGLREKSLVPRTRSSQSVCLGTGDVHAIARAHSPGTTGGTHPGGRLEAGSSASPLLAAGGGIRARGLRRDPCLRDQRCQRLSVFERGRWCGRGRGLGLGSVAGCGGKKLRGGLRSDAGQRTGVGDILLRSQAELDESA